MIGLDLDEAQEIKTLARKQAHIAAIQWEAFTERFGDTELTRRLMEIWYSHTLADVSHASFAEGIGGMFSGLQEMFGSEGEDEE